MRIRTQFLITLLLFGALLLVISASALLTRLQVKRAVQQEEIADSIAMGASELSYLSNDYVIYRESQQLSRWQSRFALFSSSVSRLQAAGPEQQALISNMQANLGRLKTVFDSIVSAIGSSAQEQGEPFDPRLLQVSWSRIAVQSQELVSDAWRLSQLLDAQAGKAERDNTIIILTMIGVFGAYFLTNFLIVQRRTLKSIARLQAGTAVIGSGNLDFMIEEKKNDEIGDLSHAFNRMASDLKKVTASKVEYQKAERRVRQQIAIQEAINRVLEQAIIPRTEEALGRTCLSVAEQLTRSKFGFLAEMNAEGLLEEIAVSDPGLENCGMTGPSGHGRGPLQCFKIQGLYGRVIQDGKAFYTNDPDSHPDNISMPEGYPKLTSFLGVPLLREGRTAGIIALGNREGGYRAEDLQAVEALAPAIMEALMRKRAEVLLKDSEEQFRRAVEEAPIPIIMHAEDGQVLQISRRWTEFTGYTLQDMPTLEAWLSQAYGEGAEAVWDHVHSLFSGNQRTVDVEFPIRTHGGEIRYWSFSASSPGILRDGRRFVVGMAVDITERKRAEQLKDEFIGMVSHELKTPLTVIIGALSVASDEQLPHQQARELIAEAGSYAIALAGIVENLLELSRYQSNRLALQAERTDISPIAQAVVQKLKAKSPLHRLRVDIGPDIPKVMIDRVRVERILSNLVENAIKYSPKGGEVRIIASLRDGQLIIGVSDQGMGISIEDQRKLFQSFERIRANETPNIPGLGLGLRVCRILVEAHGGRIWVESEKDKGSSFFFTVPLA
jgi:PAS domain S-box-containing protein